MNIEQALIQSTDRYPAWAVALFLLAASLSFAARYYAQARHGRIREYGESALGVALVLLALAVFYGAIFLGEIVLLGRPFVSRILMSLLSVANIGLNWGGVRVAIQDVSDKLRGTSS